MRKRIEDKPMAELLRYIDETYKKHYVKNLSDRQTIDEIIDNGEGIGYTKGNIRKYLNRYGNKGNMDDVREDIFKLIHYGLYLLVAHDHEHAYRSSKPKDVNNIDVEKNDNTDE